MSELYRVFSNDWKHLHDYSDEMLIELYNSESYGTKVSKQNGFALGKKWLSVQAAMWREDITSGNLKLWELYEDPKFPHWWLDSVFQDEPHKTRPVPFSSMSVDEQRQLLYNLRQPYKDDSHG